MNFEKILNNTLFNNKEILLISFFSAGLKDIDDFYFSVTEKSNHSLTIVSNNIYYIFIKFNEDNKFSLISIDGDIHTEYFIGENEIKPYLSYFKIEGELSGKGNYDRLTEKRKTFQLLFSNDSINIFAIYPEKSKKINRIIICVEMNEIKKEHKTKKIERRIEYFEITHNKSDKKINYINILNKYFNKNIKMIKSKELEELFTLHIDFKNIYNNPYEKNIIKSYIEFSLFYNMLHI